LLRSKVVQSLVFVEETGSGLFELTLIDTPGVHEVVEDSVFGVHDLNCALLANVVESDDTVGNSGRFDDANPTDLGSVVSVSTTASFTVDALDVDNSKSVSGNDTTLVQVEAVLLLSVGLVHEGFLDVDASVDDSVGSVLNGVLFFLSQGLVVSDIEMSLLGGLLGTSLPDVRSEDVTARGIHDMGASVMSQKLMSAILVDFTMDRLSLDLFSNGKLTVDFVEDDLADLSHINHIERLFNSLNFDFTGVVHLSTGCRVESTLIQDEKVARLLLFDVLEDCDNLGIELEDVVVLVVDVISLGQVHSRVENRLLNFCDTLLSDRDLVVEVARGGSFGDFSDFVDGDTP